MAVSILLYGCISWTLTKRPNKKLDGNYTRILPAVLKKSSKQHIIKQQFYGHFPPVPQTIKLRQARHANHFWRSKNEPISDVILGTLAYGTTSVARPARIIFIGSVRGGSLTRCDGQKRFKGIRAFSTPWWDDDDNDDDDDDELTFE